MMRLSFDFTVRAEVDRPVRVVLTLTRGTPDDVDYESVTDLATGDRISPVLFEASLRATRQDDEFDAAMERAAAR